tara:strand:- start:9616 stop:10152 length:537 start_codon:yes stop_codon:yes gene_type:complete
MLEDNSQLTKETQEQNVQTTNSEESVDYKSLYLQEVQNAKKLRKRSQDVEKKLTSFEKKAEEGRLSQLKENEQYKILSDELQQKLDAVNPYKEKWESYESQKRESLLSQIPEADREMLATKDLQTLEYIVKTQSNITTNNPSSSVGVSRNISTQKSWSEMNEQERREYYNFASKGGRV